MNSLSEIITQGIHIEEISPQITASFLASLRKISVNFFPHLHSLQFFTQEQFIFAASQKSLYIAFVIIEFPHPHQAHLQFIFYQNSPLFGLLGPVLLQRAEDYCFTKGCSTILSEFVNDQNNSITQDDYALHRKLGYLPLFEIETAHNLKRVFFQKLLQFNDYILIDLTHPLGANIPHWGTDVGFKYNARFVGSTSSEEKIFRVQRLEMSAGIGTHMDAPSHCFEDAPSISDIPLREFICPGIVIDVSDKAHENYAVTEGDILAFEDKYGMIPSYAFVIINTGWSLRWSEPDQYRNDKKFPSISIGAAKLLISRNINGLGVDTLSPDVFGSDFPVHRLLLKEKKYIVENVANAHQLNPKYDFIFAMPINIENGTEAPIRLFALKRKIV